MQGRIKRKQAAALPPVSRPPEDPICPLCDRPIPASQRDEHHLVPKSRGGVQTVCLHRICHRQIHALLTESELEHEFRDVDALRRHSEMGRFLAWVRSKPPEFFERSRKSERLRRR